MDDKFENTPDSISENESVKLEKPEALDDQTIGDEPEAKGPDAADSQQEASGTDTAGNQQEASGAGRNTYTDPNGQYQQSVHNTGYTNYQQSGPNAGYTNYQQQDQNKNYNYYQPGNNNQQQYQNNYNYNVGNNTGYHKTYDTGMDESPMSMGDWALTILALLIPCAGIVLYFVWAFGKNGNVNRRNYCRVQLIIMGVSIVCYIIMFMIFGFAIAGRINAGYWY